MSKKNWYKIGNVLMLVGVIIALAQKFYKAYLLDYFYVLNKLLIFFFIASLVALLMSFISKNE